MKAINWKVRLKNPVFWAQVAAAVVSPILVGLGLQWEDMTTWPALWEALRQGGAQPGDCGGVRGLFPVELRHRPHHRRLGGQPTGPGLHPAPKKSGT